MRTQIYALRMTAMSMRMTSNDEVGVKQLDNFSNVESKYPVLVTTSKLLSTGVDVQTVK